jgi:hypothetical protein
MNPSLPAAAGAVELPLRSALSLLRSHLVGAGLAHPQTPTAEFASHTEVSIEDWNLLFSAVKIRLRLAVDAPLPERDGAPAGEPNRIAVLECVEALDLLHGMLASERGRRDA